MVDEATGMQKGTMITQETRERMENIIRCIQAKLEGKIIEEKQYNRTNWQPMREDDWQLFPPHEYRIAPEPQEKHTAKLVIRPDGSKELYGGWWKGTLPSDSTIIELTETARIEPKKREPRRRWLNRYPLSESIFSSKEVAEHAGSRDSLETAVEFVEVVK